MGMSASQVRFLSLQTRKNTIGNELATLANRKSSLARDMKLVSANYDNKINNTSLKWSYDSGQTYNNISYDLLMKPNAQNSIVPYIVTDSATGKVVLNNDTLYDYDGNPIMYTDKAVTMHMGPDDMPQYTTTYAQKPLTYITLARMISEWEPPQEDNNSGFGLGSEYTNNDLISSLPDSPMFYYFGEAYEYDVSAGTMSGEANPDAYSIPINNVDFSASSSLRMSMFVRLGLITEDKLNKYNQLLVKLYGSQAAYNSDVYPTDCAMGQYYLAVANREAYTALMSEKTNVKVKNDSSTFSSSYVDGMYSYVNTSTNGYSTMLQEFEHANVGAISHLNLNASDGTGFNITMTFDDGLVMQHIFDEDGLHYKYTLGNIWGTANANITEAEAGTSVDANPRYAVYLDQYGTKTTTSIDSYVVSSTGSTTYTDVDGAYSMVMTVGNHAQADSTADSTAKLNMSDIVYSSVDSVINNLITYSNVNLNKNILTIIRSELLSSMESIEDTTYTDVDAFLRSVQSESDTGIPKVYAVSSNSTVTSFYTTAKFYVYNVNNLSKYIQNRYSQLSNSVSTKAWRVNYKYNEDVVHYLDKEVEKAEEKVNSLKEQVDAVFSSIECKQMDYYDALFQKIAQSGWIQDKKTSSESNPKKSDSYLEQKFADNQYFITECKTATRTEGYTFNTKIATNVSRLYKVYNNDENGIALQEYEEAKTEIQMKENKIDVIMNKLETEQEAITTEMDSLEKIIGDNVSTVFKMFA